MSDNLTLAEKHILDLCDAVHDCIVDGEEIHGPTVHADLGYILHHVKAAQGEKAAMLTALEIGADALATLAIEFKLTERARLQLKCKKQEEEMRELIAKAKSEVTT